MIHRDYDEMSGLIRVCGTGHWSFREIEEHYAALRAMIAGIRGAGRPVRLLSDVRQGARQAAWVEDYILDQMARTFGPGDRVAFVTDSDADREHLESLAATIELQCFVSSEQAEAWLLDDPAEREIER